IISFFELETALISAADAIAIAFLLITCAMLFIVAVDVPFQLWQHSKQLKMTKQELKDEFKETDGRPEVKGHIRRIQQRMAKQRMMSKVPKADVIITNPTHYAIALSYDRDKKSGAPKLVAKGKGLLANRIRELGEAHQVPIISAPPLARALYYATE